MFSGIKRTGGVISFLIALLIVITNLIVIPATMSSRSSHSKSGQGSTEEETFQNGNNCGTGSEEGNVGDSSKPGLIVFDLDYTLWPFWVDTHVDPPFSMKGSKVVDSHGKTINYYPEVPAVLEHIKSLGIPMAIASRTSEIDGANQLLRLFGWNKYFEQKEIYPGCKVTHFSKFKKATGLPYPSMMFFDDEERNIRDLSKEGVHCVFVRKGVTMKLLEDALQEFANKAKCQNKFTDYFKKPN